MSGVIVHRKPGGNLTIESPHQNAGDARVVIERADVIDLIQLLRSLYCVECATQIVPGDVDCPMCGGYLRGH